MNRLLTFFSLAALFFAENSANAQITVTSSNDIGIGTAAPTFPLQFSKPQIRFTSFGNYGAGTNALHIDMQNTDPRINSENKIVFYNLTSTGHVDVEARSFIQISDERLKTNIKRIAASPENAQSALGKVLQLNGYSYDWKGGMVQRSANGGGNNHQIGFLAQEVEKIIPEAVVTADSSGVKAMSYNYIIPYLVEAIKEQQKTIEELKALVAGKQANGNAPVIVPIISATKKED
ncbi:tail fiber domain-containing protein [Sphingobacterium siyangense subsp. cladoniae]|uniref:tail fiber domain-containing protein n=1 Tax=Sphingobacterium siyangense TaxID=459529 RepID=UPI0031F819A0